MSPPPLTVIRLGCRSTRDPPFGRIHRPFLAAAPSLRKKKKKKKRKKKKTSSVNAMKRKNGRAFDGRWNWPNHVASARLRQGQSAILSRDKESYTYWAIKQNVPALKKNEEMLAIPSV